MNAKRIMTEEESQFVALQWENSEEKKKLDEKRHQLIDAISNRKSCHSY